MNEENSPKGQVETTLERASELRERSAYGKRRELLQLTGGLRRVSLHLTEEEYAGLCRCGEGTLEGFLESFIADLTRSERSIWKECQHEATSWLAAHGKAERVARAYFDAFEGIDTEGGSEC